MLTQARLKSVVHYDRDSCLFTWISPTSRRVRAGQNVSGTDGNGYAQIRIDKRNYRLHRLAWLYVYGSLPSCQIDHINMIRSDNRISNLRLASNGQNTNNRGVRSDSKSGLKGVSFVPTTGKWTARVRRQHLGTFETKEDAYRAYKERATIEFGEYVRLP